MNYCRRRWISRPSFASNVVCAKCGARGRHIDVRPNWKEQPERPSLTGKEWREAKASRRCKADVDTKSEAGIGVVAIKDRLLRFGGLLGCWIVGGGYMA